MIKKKIIISSICLVTALATPMSAIAADPTSGKTSVSQSNSNSKTGTNDWDSFNFDDLSSGLSFDSDWNFGNNNTLTSDADKTATDSTTDNKSNGDDSSSGDSTTEDNSSKKSTDEFQTQMDAFLKSTGFDYKEFSSQSFKLPDMSGISTPADMKQQYEGMLKDFSSFGFGTKNTLPENSGYSINLTSAYSNTFGKGLSKNFSEYKLDTDTSKLFNSAKSTRSKLFADAMNSSEYKTVSKNLNISGLMKEIDSYKIDPSTIKTSMTGTSGLESRINNAFETGNSKSLANYNKKQGTEYNSFSEKMKDINSLKTEIEKNSNRQFCTDYDDLEKDKEKLKSAIKTNDSLKITTNNWKLNNKLATGQNLTWDEYSKLSSMDKFTWQQNSMINKLNNGLNSKINDIDDKESQNDIRNKSKSEKDSMVQSFTTSDGTKLAEKINDIQKSATSEDEKAKAKKYIKDNQKAYTNAKSELAKVEIYKIYASRAYGDWDDTDGDKLKTYLSGFKDGAKETKAWISDDGDIVPPIKPCQNQAA